MGSADMTMPSATVAEPSRIPNRSHGRPGRCPELIEAGARAGANDVATDALRRLSERAAISGTDWGLGLEARSRALLCRGAEAENLYGEAIARLAGRGSRLDLARAHLLFGEWLRRAGRRVDAREQLRVAHGMLSEMGVAGLRRARRRASYALPARRSASAPLRRATSSRRRSARSHGSPAMVCRIRRSVRGCSSARAPSSGICARCFAKLGVSSRGSLRDALLRRDRHLRIVAGDRPSDTRQPRLRRPTAETAPRRAYRRRRRCRS